ncbi:MULTISPECIES: DUF1206 domain-containing protein [Actinomadura]|uniref:DUF1206 domain-containing protein n=1 Tax=Actinomadura litoris TaxID=2678616 RepID=A0A7K1LEB8_9ACTN|nr:MULTISPECIES: DUF1206 domain-containing protein [Actinomadura]MBT2213605.1 DUF1206 domain-containing protein [Actinomadura sp. NEAU-AAG7]MUN42778.1 DUF1206 domain-containing protein [Actinomadura litoris]
MGETTVERVGRKAAGHPGFHYMTRGGLVARGLLYLLIGWLALQVAFGDGGGKEADRTGALQAVAEKPGGPVVLWLMAAGFVAIALWQAAEALYGRPVPDGDKPTKRLSSAARAVIYLAGFAATIAFLAGNSGQSSDKQSKTFTARAMAEPGGRWLILAIGIGFLVWGAVVVAGAVRRSFLKELTGMGPAARRVVQPVGVVGNLARGLVGGAVGVFLGYAALSFEPDKAQGLDGTLREFAETPAGVWGLVAVAVGVLVFGLYCFCEARWRKVEAVRRHG